LLRIEALGRNGTTAFDYAGKAVLASNRPESLSFFPDSIYQFQNADYGVKVVTVTIETAGAYTIAVTDFEKYAVSGSTAVSVGGSGPVHAFDILLPEPVFSGETFTVEISAIDQYGNRVTDFVSDSLVLELIGSGRLTLSGAPVMQGGAASVLAVYEHQGGASGAVLRLAVSGISGFWEKSFSIGLRAEGRSALEEPRNFPNPFNPDSGETSIRYYLSRDSSVQVSIYTLYGNPVWEKEFQGLEGVNYFQWNGRDDGGRSLLSGGYIVLIKKRDGTPAQKFKICILR
ncbi:MAG TPA: T9SS type A sorting domain-containing protein, partial [bacterium]|nr:T9SS type A sorting domain-containing protein [bacterium]